MIQHGIASDEEMQHDTLAVRLRAEMVNSNGVFCTLPALGIWARTLICARGRMPIAWVVTVFRQSPVAMGLR
jgi:hypothetical protein